MRSEWDIYEGACGGDGAVSEPGAVVRRLRGAGTLAQASVRFRPACQASKFKGLKIGPPTELVLRPGLMYRVPPPLGE